MKHWRFAQHIPLIANQSTTTVNSSTSKKQAHSALSTTNVPLRIYQNSPPLIDMQSPSGIQQENPIATGSKVVPGLAAQVFQPTYPSAGPTPLSWSCLQVSVPAPPIPNNAPRIRELTVAITSKKMTLCTN